MSVVDFMKKKSVKMITVKVSNAPRDILANANSTKNIDVANLVIIVLIPMKLKNCFL